MKGADKVMKKFLFILGFCALGIGFAPSAEAANFSVSIGGVPPVMVYGGGPGYYSTSYSIPFYGTGFYYSSGHHYRHCRPHHSHFSHRPPRHHGGHHGGPHGRHGGHR